MRPMLMCDDGPGVCHIVLVRRTDPDDSPAHPNEPAKAANYCGGLLILC